VWIYRDAAVLGRCLEVGPLEKRVESVKKTQRMLGIPLGIARMVAEEIGRGVHVFAALRLVRQAKEHPEATLLRLGRRIRRYGGRLGKGKVLAAVARLLGKKKADLDRALARLDEPPVQLPPTRKAAPAAGADKGPRRSLGERLGSLPAEVVDWIVHRPQILVPVAVAAGIVALLLAVLVVFGVLQLYRPQTTPGGDAATAWEERPAPPAEAPSGRRPGRGAGGTASGDSPAETSKAAPAAHQPAEAPADPPEWLKRFREKYPADRPPVLPEGTRPEDVKFFGLKGEKHKDGSPAPSGPDDAVP